MKRLNCELGRDIDSSKHIDDDTGELGNIVAKLEEEQGTLPPQQDEKQNDRETERKPLLNEMAKLIRQLGKLKTVPVDQQNKAEIERTQHEMDTVNLKILAYTQ
jgi:hypothetical protein